MPIGFFDSGVGGLSVLREALKLMPNEDYIYFGDSKNAPYGTRDMKEVRDLTFDAVHFLFDKGAKAIVVACNTATSAAVSELRRTYKDVPIVGIEPAVKPAVKLGKKGKIVIMATPFTLKQEKFKSLMSKYERDAEIVPMPCAGLVEFIEKGDLGSQDVYNYLKDKFKDFNKGDIASVVLGCTHYPFIRETLSEVLGDEVSIIDGGEGTVNEVKRRLELADLLTDRKEKGKISFYNSCEREEILELSKKLIKY
ncbi:glutamate racemase [Clostridium chrysemydis]|uniref:glutamate racemase n=1 Tax=Clostridium chrysemydis TaxID=2665504 RepID=UPI0018837C89|nr:glutamate racemase [Clostridium chrysemydis]